MRDTRNNLMEEEGVPQRRCADQQHPEWIEEGPHATLMTPDRVLALLGTFTPGGNLAQTLAEQVEIEVRRALGSEVGELVGLARMVAMSAWSLNMGLDLAVDHPLHHNQVLVQLAQRLCLCHGYDRHGRTMSNEPPALDPEHMMERVEQIQRDYGNTYRWLRARAGAGGFTYVHEAIEYAIQQKKGSAK